jgi:hypothetical protein
LFYIDKAYSFSHYGMNRLRMSENKVQKRIFRRNEGKKVERKCIRRTTIICTLRQRGPTRIIKVQGHAAWMKHMRNVHNIIVGKSAPGRTRIIFIPFSLSWKHKSRFMRSPWCLCDCVSSSTNFWMPEPLSTKFGIYTYIIVAAVRTSASNLHSHRCENHKSNYLGILRFIAAPIPAITSFDT